MTFLIKKSSIIGLLKKIIHTGGFNLPIEMEVYIPSQLKEYMEKGFLGRPELPWLVSLLEEFSSSKKSFYSISNIKKNIYSFQVFEQEEEIPDFSLEFQSCFFSGKEKIFSWYTGGGYFLSFSEEGYLEGEIFFEDGVTITISQRDGEPSTRFIPSLLKAIL